MPVPSKMSDLFTLAASNSPAGSDLIGNSLDDYLRAGFAILRSTNALASASIAAASTTDLSTADAESVQITGSATINSLGTAVPGLIRECRFAASCTIANSAAIALPGSANITTVAGDALTFRSLGSGNWIFVSGTNGFLPLAGGTLVGALGVNTTSTNAVALTLVNTNSQGAQILLQGNGASTPNKYLRAQGGFFQIVNSTNSAAIFNVDDAGNSSSGGNFSASGSLTAAQTFTSSTTAAVFASQAGGSVFLRPQGAGSATAQAALSSNGNFAANPTAAAPGSGVGSFGLVANGAWGGGIGLIDGTFNWGIYDQTGVLQFASGTSGGALSSPILTLNAAGVLTLGSTTANGAQIFLNGNGATTPNKQIRARSGNLEIVNSANTAIISSLTDGGTWTATDFIATSDKHLKKKIATKEPNDRLADLLRLCTWLWKKTGAEGHGVIAQEVQKVAPEYVQKGSNGVLGVDKAGLALECVMGLSARVRVLEGK